MIHVAQFPHRMRVLVTHKVEAKLSKASIASYGEST